MDNVFVCLGIALFVVYVPAQDFEKRVNELPPKLGLVVLAGAVCLAVIFKSPDQPKYFLWNRHRNSSATSDRIYKINKIKATLFHPDYPVNPVKN